MLLHLTFMTGPMRGVLAAAPPELLPPAPPPSLDLMLGVGEVITDEVVLGAGDAGGPMFGNGLC